MKLRNKKCLVTGANGFVGSYLVERLRKEGAIATPLTRKEADTTNFNDILPYFNGVDFVFNTVAVANFNMCIDDPLLCYRTTIQSAANVLEASRRCGIKRVVLSSSNIVYYESNPYKVAMLSAEMIGQDYVNTYSMSVISLRYANIYGKRPPVKYASTTVIDAFIKSKRESGFINIMGDGEQTRDYIHIHDVCDSNINAVLSGYCGVVDICSGINTSLNEIANIINCPIKYVPQRKGDVKHIRQNTIDAERYLDWKYKIPIKEGVSRLMEE